MNINKILAATAVAALLGQSAFAQMKEMKKPANVESSKTENLEKEITPVKFAQIQEMKKPANVESSKTENLEKVITPANLSVALPEPFATPSTATHCTILGWPAGKGPKAPAGFTVTRFAEDLDNPRNLYVAPNGDVFVAMANTADDGKNRSAAKLAGTAKQLKNKSSANVIMILRDANKDGKPEIAKVFLRDLNRPYGMLVIGNTFYVGNTDGLYAYPYKAGQTEITEPGKKILELPAGGYNNHWTRNLLANADNSKIYITVGSGSNVAEHGIDNEKRRACILEVNPDGSGEVEYAGGLRNPVGIAWEPVQKTLWTVVNERDDLGDELVPDYATGVKRGAFYGWPYAYFGKHPDPRMKGEGMDLVKSTVTPDVPVGSHTGTLGIAFNTGKKFPSKYEKGAFIGQHGSWNRKELTGYRVAYIPFTGGKPAGPPEDFLTGFIADLNEHKVYGRPVDVQFQADGSMLVSDDGGDIVWRVAAK
ncbi:MAG: sorbosone dehydrogenase family protein [Bacteroidota bacterium]